MTPNRAKRWIPYLAVVVGGVLAGGAAVYLATPEVRRPELKPIEFNLVRPESREYVASPQKALEIPYRYGDFDLDATIEMSADTELDIVFHKIAEWEQTTEEHVPPFHARFDVLRISTRGEGRAFLTSEQALFDDEVSGVRVQPGSPATVVLQGRGHRVRANVVGTEVGWFETRDDHGNMAFVVRGGRVVIKRLWIKPWASPSRLLPMGWGAILGAVLGVVLLLLRSAPLRQVVALVVLVFGGVVARLLVMGTGFLVAAEPATASVVVAGLCFLPLSVGIAAPGRWMTWRVVAGVVVAGLVVALLALEYVARAEWRRLQAFEDPRMDLYFGQQSGSAPFDALGRRVANNRAIHYPLPGMGEAARYDVLFLGGGLMFDFGDRQSMAGLEKNVVSQVAGHLKHNLKSKRNVETAALPTLTPHSYQQLLLAKRFYLKAFRPRVVVLGLWDSEAQPALPMRARDLEKSVADADTRGWSTLVELWRRRGREPVVPGGPDDLRQTLQDLEALCKQYDGRLVLALDKSLDPERVAVVKEFVQKSGGRVPLVEGFDIFGGVYPIQKLVQVIQKLIE